MFATSVASSFSEARGAGLEGTWLTEGGASKIHFERCGAGLCARLVWLREPIEPATVKPRLDRHKNRALLGIVMLSRIRPIRPLEWSARAYSTEDSRTRDVTLRLTLPKQLALKSCVLWALICRKTWWSRVD